MPEEDLQRRLLRRQLLWQGLAGAGALAVGPALLRTLAPPAPAAGLNLGAAQLIAAVPAPPVVSRSGWGADEGLRRGSPDFAPLNRVIVHHTVTAIDEPDPAARIRAIHAFHVQGNDWSDIGYNFLVDQAGRIYEGRAGGGPSGEDGSGRGVIGAHAAGHNTGSVGVAILGTFTDDRATPSDAALDAVAAVTAWKLGTRGIDPLAQGAVIGHRDVVATGCPGNGCQRRLAEVRERARARIVGVGTPSDDGDDGLLGGLLGGLF